MTHPLSELKIINIIINTDLSDNPSFKTGYIDREWIPIYSIIERDP